MQKKGAIMATSRKLWGRGMLALITLAACAPDSASQGESMSMSALEAELMAADRAFNLATAESGADGWASFFVEDGTIVQSGVGQINGRAAIHAAMAPYFAGGAKLAWDPLRAEASADGTLGYTIGEFESEGATADGETVISRGLYVSIWRRETDGSWRVVMDLGNPVDTPPDEG